nr:MAG TPA: hypothetical protein [Caudoviricetes sp.]DAW99646.1 MAG TPA: hypothetical protein [Bacteriophage sp.]
MLDRADRFGGLFFVPKKQQIFNSKILIVLVTKI